MRDGVKPWPCMTPEEWAMWSQAARQVRNGASVPCYDCPASWAAQMKGEGLCDRVPMRSGSPRRFDDTDHAYERIKKAMQRAAAKA